MGDWGEREEDCWYVDVHSVSWPLSRFKKKSSPQRTTRTKIESALAGNPGRNSKKFKKFLSAASQLIQT